MITPFLMLLAAAQSNAGGGIQCNSYAVAVTQTDTRDYDPASPVKHVVRLRLRATDPALPSSCAGAAVTVRPQGSSTFALRQGGDVLPSQLAQSRLTRSGPTAIDLLEDGKTDLVRAGNVDFEVYDIPAGAFVREGDYTTPIDVLVGGNVVATYNLRVSVGPTMRFEGASQSGRADLSLGEITDGALASSAFFFRTNADLSITASSAGGGFLVHELGPAYGRIGYSATISGQPIAIGGAPVILGFSGTGIRSEELTVTVPPSPRQFAGKYRDTITLEFTPF